MVKVFFFFSNLLFPSDRTSVVMTTPQHHGDMWWEGRASGGRQHHRRVKAKRSQRRAPPATRSTHCGREPTATSIAARTPEEHVQWDRGCISNVLHQCVIARKPALPPVTHSH